MLETLLYLVLIIIVLNLLFSFVAIDNRIVALIIVLVILGFFFGGGRSGHRLFCSTEANDGIRTSSHDSPSTTGLATERSRSLA